MRSAPPPSRRCSGLPGEASGGLQRARRAGQNPGSLPRLCCSRGKRKASPDSARPSPRGKAKSRACPTSTPLPHCCWDPHGPPHLVPAGCSAGTAAPPTSSSTRICRGSRSPSAAPPCPLPASASTLPRAAWPRAPRGPAATRWAFGALACSHPLVLTGATACAGRGGRGDAPRAAL